MAHSAGASVQDVVSGGIGLAFIAFPKIISSMGSGGDLFGFLFFASLTVAGITSMVSILQVPIQAFQDKLAWSHKKSVTIVAGGSAVVSTLIFSTHSAITFVDIIDYFANNIGIVGGGLLSIILVSWFRRPLLTQLKEHINQYSSIKLGAGWSFLLTVITPLSLLVALLLTVKSVIAEGYGGYSADILWIVGGATIAVFVLGAIGLSCMKDKESGEN